MLGGGSVSGWSLGWRLAARPRGTARSRAVLAVLGFAFAAFILTVMVALIQGTYAREDRTRATARMARSSGISPA